jgi:NAD(P)-dependent dehydrogenase (short-subunit alcohol dehydrogenase family)
MDPDLTGRVAVVTGAFRGIGLGVLTTVAAEMMQLTPGRSPSRTRSPTPSRSSSRHTPPAPPGPRSWSTPG